MGLFELGPERVAPSGGWGGRVASGELAHNLPACDQMWYLFLAGLLISTLPGWWLNNSFGSRARGRTPRDACGHVLRRTACYSEDSVTEWLR